MLNGGMNQIILRFLFLFALLLEKDVVRKRLSVYNNFVE